jgi:hypothetical protein
VLIATHRFQFGANVGRNSRSPPIKIFIVNFHCFLPFVSKPAGQESILALDADEHGQCYAFSTASAFEQRMRSD